MAVLCWLAMVLAALPVVMIAGNLFLFRRPNVPVGRPAVSVIVPVRNEEAAVGACLQALLGNEGVELEIIVVDDHSEDATATIVQGMAAADARVQLVAAPVLPFGWSGKQHACHAGAMQASHPVLLFMDCDVRVTPSAVAAMAGFLTASGAALVSGFPRERTLTVGETLLIPLIHVLLLGYLPIGTMRRSRQPSLGAGCGQIMVADAAAYRVVGGHAVIRHSWHDGVQLPRAFRRRGYRTDIFDAGALAECRMYRGFGETWRGLSKNAREGMATRAALPVWTVLLGGGLVMPFVLLPVAWTAGSAWPVVGSVAAVLLVRLILALRFRQSLWSVPLLPVGVVLLLLLQWRALLGRTSRRTPMWRGRTQVPG